MQTPSKQNQPQTPMIPINRRLEGGLDRMLRRATEGAKDIERPKLISLGKVISELDSIGSGMKEMRNQIRNEIRVKQKFYNEETKILKKDSENLESISSKLLRRSLAGLAAGVSISQFASGNIKGGLQGAGLASLLMAPEIIETISGTVIQALAVRGLIGGRQTPTAGIARNIGGASKFRNPLLITAALAASLIIPSLAKGQQSGDRRRQELTKRNIIGRETINKSDVVRYRGLLARFEEILDGINLENRKKIEQSTLNISKIEKGKDIDDVINDASDDIESNKDKSTENVGDTDKDKGFFGGLLDGIKNLFNDYENDTKLQFEEFFDIKLEENNDLSRNENVTNTDITNESSVVSNFISEKNTNITEGNISSDNILNNTQEFISQNVDNISNISKQISFDNVINNEFFGDNISNKFESVIENIDLSLLSPTKNVANTKTNMSKNVSNNIIDLGDTQQQQSSSGFTGLSAIPTSVFVSTKFNSSGGAIDKFDSAASLRSYGAFS
tara:strand:- start:3027 stop:4538 length:1512 start_codon:yes stop_codon:yes gene_type:complete